MKNISAIILAALAILATPVAAQDMSAFHAGTAITGHGKIASIDSDMPIPEGTILRVAFDTSTAKEGTVNRSLDSAARFINMHVEAGVPVENIHLAIVVHGPAVFDVVSDAAYARKYADATTNPNTAIVAALLEKGVEIIVCGQSATAQNVTKADLLPGVKMALSAMTAHALLQQQGYTLNPF